MDFSVLDSLGIFTQEQCRKLCDKNLLRAQTVFHHCQEEGYQLISVDDRRYPRQLFVLNDFPLVLYVQGNAQLLQELSSRPALAVVGTRGFTSYGARATEMMCTDLVSSGYVIISGLASGIDAEAHYATIKAGGQTIAVLGCGLDQDYPACNHVLRRAILQTGGAVLSELPPYAEANKKYFPVRNRLIAGLSQGVLVVEAPRRSGALITASCALNQGKDVFAVPANIDEPASRGVLELLREGAIPAITPDDIKWAYEIRWPEYRKYSQQESYVPPISLEVRQAEQDPKPVTYFELPDDVQETEETQSQSVSAPKEIIQHRPQEDIVPPAQQQDQTEPVTEWISDEHKTVYLTLTKEPQQLEQIARKCGMSIGKVTAILFELGVPDPVKAYPGKLFSL